MFLWRQYRLLPKRAGLLLWGHLLDGFGCLHFNLAFICVLSSKDSCHRAEIHSSGLCLDKVNKWFATLARQVGMSKVKGSELQAAKLGLRTPYALFSSIWLLPMCPRTWTNNVSTQLTGEFNVSIVIQSPSSSSSLNFSAEQRCFDWDLMWLKQMLGLKTSNHVELVR